MFLLFGKAPEYPSILHCSLIRHFVLACFQSAGLITVPIAIDHICLVFMKRRLKVFNMVGIQVIITFIELFFTLAHLAVGDVTINDICAQWIASPDVFLISMSFNNTLLLFAVITNFTLVVVQVFERSVYPNSSLDQNFPYSFVLLLQGTTELVLSFPLTVRQWNVLLAARGLTP
uniref:G_PROTEIN_RECEP_F1_2 domain-containing protein n=1 Tax=Caenorhabditis tropicalis TaxID=1561998 RepID=A0A1I7UMC2_9PELO